MIETEVSFTSLCFIEDHHDERVWLHRLADIEDGELHSPFKSDRIDNRFENRDCWYLYQHRDNRDNFSAVKSQFQFTDSVANNLFIIQTATLFRLRSHIQRIVKYVCFGFIGILKSVRIIL